MKHVLTILILINISLAQENSEPLNSVHEWGVVVFERNAGPVICGSPWQESALFINEDLSAKAPVIWIYGEPFQGTFRVEVGTGETITMVYPNPDSLDYEFAEWSISTVHNTEEIDEFLYDGPFAWAVESWRNVPSLYLFNENTGITENFLYYECTVNSDFPDKFFHWNSEGNPVFSGIPIDDALAFTPYGVIQVALQEDSFVPNEYSIDGISQPEQVIDVFTRWAGSKLYPSEIEALWETWEPAFTESGHYWLVFPIPDEHNNEISKIHLETSDQRNVEYNRLFLAAVRISLP